MNAEFSCETVEIDNYLAAVSEEPLVSDNPRRLDRDHSGPPSDFRLTARPINSPVLSSGNSSATT